jgi:F0F1-type ATP synthase assembly protein I
MSEELICSDHPIRHSTEKQSLVTLIGLGALLLIIELYIFGAHRHNRFYSLLIWLLISGIPFVFAVWWTFRPKKFPANTLLTILIGAALFRFILVPLDPPRLSTDVYRYIWDGRLQGAGINPYLYVPVDPRLAGLRDDSIYPNINRKEYAHTIYPPVAQAFFFLVTRATQSVPGFKGVLVLIDLVTVGLVAATLRAIGQPAERVIAYAWHPLPIFEFGGSGHIDALMICFIALALFARAHQKSGIAGLALGAATLVKFIPIVLLPAIYRRWDKKLPIAFAITLFVFYLPYVLGAGTGVLGFLPQYANEEGLRKPRNSVDLFCILPGARVFGPALSVLSLVLQLVGSFPLFRSQCRCACPDINQLASLPLAVRGIGRRSLSIPVSGLSPVFCLTRSDVDNEETRFQNSQEKLADN